MDAQTLLQSGHLNEALAACQGEVRQQPGDVVLRVRLYALECILGRYDKALAHLDTIASLNPEWDLPARVNRMLIACELTRREVFAGRRKPLVLGEPPSWTVWCAEAMAQDAAGKGEDAWQLRAKAWDEAPAIEAIVNDQSCAWLSDADLRLGPVLEVYMEGGYYWIPFTQLKRLTSQPPKVLAELVWLPAKLLLATDAEVNVHLPVRYPGTEEVSDGELRLARRTEWRETASGGSVGLGQKLFESDRGEFGLLECTGIEFGLAGQGSGATQ